MKLFRCLFIGCACGAIYFPAIINYIRKIGKSFDVLSVEHWERLFQHYQNGWIPIDNDQRIFVAVLIGFMPVFLLIWFAVCKVVKNRFQSTASEIAPVVDKGLSAIALQHKPVLIATPQAKRILPAKASPAPKTEDEHLEKLAKSYKMGKIIFKAFINTSSAVSKKFGFQQPEFKTDIKELSDNPTPEQIQKMKNDMQTFNQLMQSSGISSYSEKDFNPQEMLDIIRQEPEPIKREAAALGFKQIMIFFEEQRKEDEKAIDNRLAELGNTLNATII